MPEPRRYLVSERMVRRLFVGSALLMALTLITLLTLAMSRPQGRPVLVDDAVYRQHLRDASEQLSGFRELPDGTVQISIDRAIELVADRGVANPFTAVASAQGAPGAVGDGQAALPDGETVYANCAACHGAEGQGVPGAFPPLAGHAPDLLAASREFLVDVVLFGMQGPIEVAGMNYNGLMPAWGHLSDAEVAAVLDHILVSWGNDAGLPADYAPITAEEVGARRGESLTPAQVHELRGSVGLPQ